MKIELKHCEQMTQEKAEFIEAKIDEMYDFVLDSRKCLNQEAHTTLNWLFAIIVGGAGYAVTQIVENKMQCWVIAPIAVMVVVCIWQAIRLFQGALQASSIYPKGNEPKNLITAQFVSSDLHWMRLAETANMQERISHALSHNRKMGDAINRARWAVVLMPFIAAVGAAIALRINVPS